MDDLRERLEAMRASHWFSEDEYATFREVLDHPERLMGEPVAWRVIQDRRDFLVPQAQFTLQSYDYGQFIPLYAPPEVKP